MVPLISDAVGTFIGGCHPLGAHKLTFVSKVCHTRANSSGDIAIGDGSTALMIGVGSDVATGAGLMQFEVHRRTLRGA